MGNLIRMDLYRMNRGKSFRVCLILAFAVALLATPLLPRALRKLTAGREERPLVAIGQAALYMLLLVLSVSYLAMGSHNPFIYFNF